MASSRQHALASLAPDSNDGDPVETLEQWLGIDSTTGRERVYLNHLESIFDRLGYHTHRQPVADQRWNLIALPADLPDADTPSEADPSLLFSTHVDTVPPHLDVRRDGDTLYGRGACDTKGGQWAMLRAGQTLRARGHNDFGFLFVVGEEVDHCGAKRARNLNLDPQRILLCEPTQNRLVTGQKGMVKLELLASGVAGHSAFPDQGDSAIHHLLDALHALRAHDWPSDDTLGTTTLNVGILEGGTAANVFAPDARAEVLFRTVRPAHEILSTIEDLLDPALEWSDVSSNDPVRFDLPDDPGDTCVVPFNTDAAYLQALGPIWLTGPGDIRVAHSDDEHITSDALHQGAALYTRLAQQVLT